MYYGPWAGDCDIDSDLSEQWSLRETLDRQTLCSHGQALKTTLYRSRRTSGHQLSVTNCHPHRPDTAAILMPMNDARKTSMQQRAQISILEIVFVQNLDISAQQRLSTPRPAACEDITKLKLIHGKGTAFRPKFPNIWKRLRNNTSVKEIPQEAEESKPKRASLAAKKSKTNEDANNNIEGIYPVDNKFVLVKSSASGIGIHRSTHKIFWLKTRSSHHLYATFHFNGLEGLMRFIPSPLDGKSMTGFSTKEFRGTYGGTLVSAEKGQVCVCVCVFDIISINEENRERGFIVGLAVSSSANFFSLEFDAAKPEGLEGESGEKPRKMKKMRAELYDPKWVDDEETEMPKAGKAAAAKAAKKKKKDQDWNVAGIYSLMSLSSKEDAELFMLVEFEKACEFADDSKPGPKARLWLMRWRGKDVDEAIGGKTWAQGLFICKYDGKSSIDVFKYHLLFKGTKKSNLAGEPRELDLDTEWRSLLLEKWEVDVPRRKSDDWNWDGPPPTCSWNPPAGSVIKAKNEPVPNPGAYPKRKSVSVEAQGVFAWDVSGAWKITPSGHEKELQDGILRPTSRQQHCNAQQIFGTDNQHTPKILQRTSRSSLTLLQRIRTQDGILYCHCLRDLVANSSTLGYERKPKPSKSHSRLVTASAANSRCTDCQCCSWRKKKDSITRRYPNGLQQVVLSQATYHAMIFRGTGPRPQLTQPALLGQRVVLANADWKNAPSVHITANGPQNSGQATYYYGVQGQATGVPAPTSCERCARNWGPFHTCKTVPGYYRNSRRFLGGKCAGCTHDRQPCSFTSQDEGSDGDGDKSGKEGSDDDELPPKAPKKLEKSKESKGTGTPGLQGGQVTALLASA
ncbi:hypothetical protein DL98DRAFT_640025 [Cadophora sp. DSE1049]|nr:hypothetical protein DL98DRAFT_640025 [Cadophora sp. DSE1049]